MQQNQPKPHEKRSEAEEIQRGRSFTKNASMRLPSRTPSPSGYSDASTLSTGVSLITKEDSLSEVSLPDLQDRGNDPSEVANLPIKNTFVHFKTDGTEDIIEEPRRLLRSATAPCTLLTNVFEIKNSSTQAEKEELHQRGECTPCAYFAIKADGCRWGSECSFCHLCSADDLRLRKKKRVKAAKDKKRVPAECFMNY
jgi:hypothetical protein